MTAKDGFTTVFHYTRALFTREAMTREQNPGKEAFIGNGSLMSPDQRVREPSVMLGP
ncbi:MAG TPA: hypothetical protein VMU36_04990 [Spirochaetia bacterium]|nr:hypothetical protein [Spirochaetia bacterium]